MNKKLLLITSAAIASASIYSFSGVAVAATGSDDATATVVQAISISPTPVTSLHFGDIVPGTGGTVIITTTDSANTGTITPTNNPSRAEFTVDGQNGKTYAVTVPGSVTLNGTPSGTMTASTFTYNGGGGIGNPGVVINTGGPLYIGATLTVGSGQAAGTYTGTYNVSVDYN